MKALHEQATPSLADGDGVRESALAPGLRLAGLLAAALGLAALGGAAAWLLHGPPQRPTPAELTQPAVRAGIDRAASTERVSVPTTVSSPVVIDRVPATVPAEPFSPPAEWRSGDTNDLATYVSPGDPVPTAGELIRALRASGEHGGIAAFNPPGTSPPLQGLAVPEDFELPPGYVRHHQVSDDGEVIEAILMFSPDYSFRDAEGREVAIPEDRVVPPDMAPPGLPLRQVEIPPSG